MTLEVCLVNGVLLTWYLKTLIETHYCYINNNYESGRLHTTEINYV